MKRRQSLEKVTKWPGLWSVGLAQRTTPTPYPAPSVWASVLCAASLRAPGGQVRHHIQVSTTLVSSGSQEILWRYQAPLSPKKDPLERTCLKPQQAGLGYWATVTHIIYILASPPPQEAPQKGQEGGDLLLTNTNFRSELTCSAIPTPPF